MAKGRKHSLIHQDRLLGSFGYGQGYTQPAAAPADGDLPDLGEDDVWYALGADGAGGDGESSGGEGWYGGSVWRAPGGGGGGGEGTPTDGRRPVGGLSAAFDSGAPRVVHRYRDDAGGTSSWGGSHGRQPHTAASAPVSVPGWPGAHRRDSADSPPAHAECDGGGDDGGWMPPHEYLAREYGSGGGRVAAGSVFEGVGRTLKGRDLRRLRDAVWSQTGFYG